MAAVGTVAAADIAVAVELVAAVYSSAHSYTNFPVP